MDTQPGPKQPVPHVLVEWVQYVAFTRERISDRYGRFYAALAVVMAGLTFMPLFEDVVSEDDFTASYGSIFDMAGRPGGGPAVVGLLLLVALIGLLVTAAFRAHGAALPGSIAGLAALIVLMLATKPGTGTPAPDLTGSGRAGLVLAVCTVVLGMTHVVHLSLTASSAEDPMRG